MKLPIPSFGKKAKQKYILALLLRDEKISALITEEVEGKMRIVGQHEEILNTPLEKLDSEAWLDTLDRTISKAEETLPPDRETHDTVFGVKESWVEEKKIKKDYLLHLKKISEALDLTPIGFLVISEAITHLIQEEEGAPVSAILVDIGKLSVTATLVRGGKVLETQSVRREGSLPESVDTALKHLVSVDVFPARVILFLGSSPLGVDEDIEHLAQQFISHHWSKSLPFLHAPQISVLHSGFDAKAVVQGAASQMGFEVLNLTRDEEAIRNFDAHDKGAPEETPAETHHSKKEAGEELLPEEEKKATKNHESLEESMPDEDFGFVMNKDVTEVPPVKADNFERVKSTPEPEPSHETRHHPAPTAHESFSDEQHDSEDTLDEEEVTDEKPGIVGKVTGLLSALPLTRLTSLRLPSNLRVPSLLLSGKGKKLILLPVLALLILGGLYFFYVSSQKADITLYLKPNNVTENADILFSTDSGNNFSEDTVEAQTVSTELDGKTSTSASGKKAVGEKAKGSVTLYNSDNAKKQISSGTTISSDKGLKFIVDKDVSIASASGDIFSGTKPGTAQVSVTAAEFGSDYNLPSGTKFNVSGASNIAAKNDSAFSGGTKKDVTVVSKKDQDKLIADLSKSLQGNALEELGKKATGDKKLLPFLTQASVTGRKFDHKVDDEAKTVTLTGTVSFEALTYSQKDLEDYAKVVLKDKYADNLNLSEKGVTLNLEDEKQKDEGQVSASLTIQAGLVPKIDTEGLSGRLQGKSVTDAQEELKQIPQVAEAKIVLSPSLPFLPAFLPKGAEKITVHTALHE